MATTTTMRQTKTDLLHLTLRANTIVSAAAGLILIVASGALAPFMGIASPIPLIIVGAVCLAFAYGVHHEASRPQMDRRAGWVIFALDVFWVAASILILEIDASALSTEGRWIILIAAADVALFALGEFVGLRRLR